MTYARLLLIRHGPTDWNEAGRIQGRSDRALSEAGRRLVASWRLPADVATARWCTSPMTRAIETAALLGHPDAAVVSALTAMHWGAWEGWTLAQLREREGEAMARNEARGLDFRPPGGESPREIQQRLAPWLREIGLAGATVVAVTHKEVVRALYALASGWDMTADDPGRPRTGAAHCFTVDAAGQPRIERLNIALAP